MQQRNDILKFIALAASALAMATTASARAHISDPEPYHLPHLRGVYVDAKGNPIPDAAVTVDRDDKVQESTKTDRSGRFEIKHIAGHYWLHVHKNGYSPVGREIIVGEALTYVHTGTLYVIAGPSACSDDCSSVFTSKSKFNKAIRRNTGHQD